MGEKLDDSRDAHYVVDHVPSKMIATILKALRGQLKENDQLNAVEEIAGRVPEIPLEYDQILKEEERFSDDVSGGYLPEDFLCWPRDVKRLSGYILKVYTKFFQCKSARMQP